MARYPLEPLLSARRYREEAAAREARLAQRRLDEAREAAEAANVRLRVYREWRPGEEERLFGEVRGKVIPRSGLDDHRGDIQALRQTELDLDESRLEAEKVASVRAAELKDAKRRHIAAVRGLRKIEAHREIWQREEALREERAEEAELEDFTVRPDDEAVAEAPEKPWA